MTCFYVINFAVYEQLKSGIEVRLGSYIPRATIVLGHSRGLDTSVSGGIQ
jgi:hypothetical protein